ncbi:hypothetical protein BKA93DRAFT_822680 [Sparassis latifolia]|uniref:Homeobox domain-containing protein n=1 Tax=Sparassis crispa TaxID=139825 RepID=A0A401GH12_9APHY|nr:hypothetical protein SCP_0311870 [Sparassis crispa]GBE81458.1 hypothetical protein SCP_0311870 [Sparassis crispa]
MYTPTPHPRSATRPSSRPKAKVMATFCAYQPDQQKSRRRTSRREKRRLEAVYLESPTPDKTLITTLAKELNMEQQTVRIWFQNRRAKAKKLDQRMMQSKGSASLPSPQEVDEHFHPETPDGQSFRPHCGLDTPEQLNPTSPAYLTESSEPQPSMTTSTSSPVDSLSDQIPGPSRIPTSVQPLARLPTHSMPVPMSHNDAPRRTSLPNFRSSVLVSSYSASPSSSTNAAYALHPHYSPSTSERDHGDMPSFSCAEAGGFLPSHRRSAHTLTHIERLSSNPYAKIVKQCNTNLYGDFGALFARHYSFDSGRAAEPPYVLSVRDVGAPPPGPLPAPDYCFGAPYAGERPPTPALAPQSAQSPIVPYALESGKDGSRKEDEYDVYEHGVRLPPPYPYEFSALPSGPGLRFGSMASVGGSESSLSSAFYSESSSGNRCGWENAAMNENGRRASTESHFLRRVAELTVDPTRIYNVHPNSVPSSRRPSQVLVTCLMSGEQSHSHASTVVEGGPLHQPEPSLPGTGVALLQRHSSSLAHALDCPEEPNHRERYSVGDVTLSFPPEYTFPHVVGEPQLAYDIPPDADAATRQVVYAAHGADHQGGYAVQALQEHGHPSQSHSQVAPFSRYAHQYDVGTVDEPRADDYEDLDEGQRGAPPMYRTGAVELDHMCVPANATSDALQFVRKDIRLYP